MKIFLLCNSQSNQIALANKIHENFNLDHLIVWKQKKKIPFSKIILNFLSHFFTFFKFRSSWINMLKYYKKKYKDFPIKPSLIVEDINSDECKEIIINFKPELVLVSGTNLLKKELIDLINQSGKIMNLHTGISPYVKGGPNCTNWCLYLKKFHLIGNTVHWIDEGIDSGDIITTDNVVLDGSENLNDLHIKVMESAHQLYIKTINHFFKKKEIIAVNQNNFTDKKLFKTKDWKFFNMLVALFNFYFFYNKASLNKKNFILVKLND